MERRSRGFHWFLSTESVGVRRASLACGVVFALWKFVSTQETELFSYPCMSASGCPTIWTWTSFFEHSRDLAVLFSLRMDPYSHSSLDRLWIHLRSPEKLKLTHYRRPTPV